MTGAQVYESRFRIIRDEVQPGFHAEAASARRLGAGYPFRVVDPVALRPADELYKSLSVISEDRKYFSGASGIKLADKEHPSPGLWDSEMFAVKHRPFDMIPQVMKCGEDDCKRPAAVMRKQSGDIFE